MNKETLKQIIIDTIKGEEHLGENLKNQCVDYIEQLQNNWNELKEYLKEKMSVYEQQEASNFYVVLNKMQEIEKNDSNE